MRTPRPRKNPPQDPLIARLYRHRINKSLLLDDLALDLGYSRMSIGFWETGEKQPTAFSRSVIAAYLEAQE